MTDNGTPDPKIQAPKHFASPMGDAKGLPSIASDGSTERWYLRIDGKEFGPITRSQMEFFLRPPRLCSLLQVMCTVQEGVWHSIARHETIDKVLSKFGIEDLPVKTSTVPITQTSQASAYSPSAISSRIRDRFEDAVAWFVKYRIESLVVVAFIAINAAILIASADTTGRDREILNRYESIWKSTRELSTKKASDDEWKTFADASIVEIEPILKELQRTANVRQPVRQSLLFGGRENLLRILNDGKPPELRSSDALIFERRLKRIREMLPKG